MADSPMRWRDAHLEFPPEDYVVWTARGNVVRKGIWYWGGPGAELEKSGWTDEDGNEILVSHWIWIDASPGSVPMPPA